MRILLAGGLILILFGAGCTSPTSTPGENNLPLGSEIELSVGESAVFEDGLTAQLTAINDSRCQPGVVCIWEGELSPVLTLSGGNLHANVEVTLGTSTKPTSTVGTYTVNLIEATESAATISIN